jgi:signal transduction histidine kinase
MRRKIYYRFIKPISMDSDQAEREIVLNYLLAGVFALFLAAFAAAALQQVLTNEPSHPYRQLGKTLAVLLVIGIYFAARSRRRFRAAAVILTLAITAFGCLVTLQWGMLDPYGALLLSLSVVMAGILVGARYSLYLTGVLVLFLIYVQRGESTGSLHPNLSWQGTDPLPVAGDVVAFAAILFVIAFVSWLFNRQMELSLKRAQRSERALKRQKSLLEVKVQQRTQELQAAQLEQMGELYRFAELGRLSTALFHDLANHLTTVSVDIEGLKDKHESELMGRIHNNVRHIDDVVQRVRQQIQGKTSIEIFNIMDEIHEVIEILAFDAERAGVSMMLEPGNVRPGLSYRGDVTRFRQLLLNLISNGIEAYAGQRRGRREKTVVIRLERIRTTLVLSVTDYGSIIPSVSLKKIFEPFYTTKPKGVGIGLFIAKQVAENTFGGGITASSDKSSGTTFSVSLPKSYYAHKP